MQAAAIVRKSDNLPVVAFTSIEMPSPLSHRELMTTTQFYELSDKSAAKECIFLATHEP